MPERFPASLQQKIEDRLRYYEDLGIRLFYTDRGPSFAASEEVVSTPLHTPAFEETALPKTTPKPAPAKIASVVMHPPLVVPPAVPSLFETTEKVKDETLLKIREDLGECTRCKLYKGRNKIVFGDGNPRAELVFVGEGPGADEDAQGLPFVGRAGKLLTQMIEAMGLQRKDVYICNVVKCRPPENRAPEPDEVAACSPFLIRQIDSIHPKVIVCLGATAAKTILNTTRGISQFRGEWLDWRGHKLMATYHPAYLLRNPPAKADVWKDLQKVMAELGLQLPKKSKS
ncbi:MAG TPA: uracil-DNA glycosylase [Candidatus Acidoferrum sp.]|nr:uracil-DNA glycosylase [Candidatus Acidoferrum sp.]